MGSIRFKSYIDQFVEKCEVVIETATFDQMFNPYSLSSVKLCWRIDSVDVNCAHNFSRVFSVHVVYACLYIINVQLLRYNNVYDGIGPDTGLQIKTTIYVPGSESAARVSVVKNNTTAGYRSNTTATAPVVHSSSIKTESVKSTTSGNKKLTKLQPQILSDNKSRRYRTMLRERLRCQQISCHDAVMSSTQSCACEQEFVVAHERILLARARMISHTYMAIVERLLWQPWSSPRMLCRLLLVLQLQIEFQRQSLPAYAQCTARSIRDVCVTPVRAAVLIVPRVPTRRPSVERKPNPSASSGPATKTVRSGTAPRRTGMGLASMLTAKAVKKATPTTGAAVST